MSSAAATDTEEGEASSRPTTPVDVDALIAKRRQLREQLLALDDQPVTATLSDDEEDLNEKSEVTTETRDTSVVSQTTSDTLAPPEKRAHIEKTSVSEENAAPDEQSKPSIPINYATALRKAPPSLPLGWKRVTDHRSGVVLYHHKETNVLTVSRPYIITHPQATIASHHIPAWCIPCIAYRKAFVPSSFKSRKAKNKAARQQPASAVDIKPALNAAEADNATVEVSAADPVEADEAANTSTAPMQSTPENNVEGVRRGKKRRRNLSRRRGNTPTGSSLPSAPSTPPKINEPVIGVQAYSSCPAFALRNRANNQETCERRRLDFIKPETLAQYVHNSLDFTRDYEPEFLSQDAAEDAVKMQASRAAFLSAKDRRREQLAQRMMLSPNTGIQVAPKRLVIAYREGRLDELAATFGYVEPMRFVHVPMIEIAPANQEGNADAEPPKPFSTYYVLNPKFKTVLMLLHEFFQKVLRTSVDFSPEETGNALMPYCVSVRMSTRPMSAAEQHQGPNTRPIVRVEPVKPLGRERPERASRAPLVTSTTTVLPTNRKRRDQNTQYMVDMRALWFQLREMGTLPSQAGAGENDDSVSTSKNNDDTLPEFITLARATGANKKAAKLAAAGQALDVLVPGAREHARPTVTSNKTLTTPSDGGTLASSLSKAPTGEAARTSGHVQLAATLPEPVSTDSSDVDETAVKEETKPTTSIFDQLAIDDERVPAFCQQANQMMPYTLLGECLRQNILVGEGGTQAHLDCVKQGAEDMRVTIRVGDRVAEVVSRNKRDGREKAAQAMLAQLHANDASLRSWGALQRQYALAARLRLHEMHTRHAIVDKAQLLALTAQEKGAAASVRRTIEPSQKVLSLLKQELGRLYKHRSRAPPDEFDRYDAKELPPPATIDL